MSATLTAQMMQPYHALVKRNCYDNCSQLPKDTMECIVTSVPINDKYPAAIHTSNRVYTTSTQHTRLLYFSMPLYLNILRLHFPMLYYTLFLTYHYGVTTSSLPFKRIAKLLLSERNLPK